MRYVAALENQRHEKFVQNLVAGMSQRKAYRDAYPSAEKWKDSAADSQASRLFSNPKVFARYNEIQEEQKKAALLTRWKKRKILADIAADEDQSTADRMKAIDLDNKMEGEYTDTARISIEPVVIVSDLKE